MQALLFLSSYCLATFAPGLYGIVMNDTASQFALVRVDTKTGLQTVINTFWKVEELIQNGGSLDQKNGIFYLLGFDSLRVNLIGINVTDGATVSKVEVPAIHAEGMTGLGQGMAWEPDTGDIIVLGRDKTKSFKVGTVNPKTGTFNQVAYLNNSAQIYDPVEPTTAVYSPATREFMQDIGIITTHETRLMIVNMDSGNFTLASTCSDVGSFSYDRVTETIFGLGGITDDTQPDGWMRTLIQMTPDGSACPSVGNITGYGIVAATTIDVQARVLYMIATPCVNKGDIGCDGSGPLDLVTVDLKTAKVLAVVSGVCRFVEDTCPWVLQFGNSV